LSTAAAETTVDVPHAESRSGVADNLGLVFGIVVVGVVLVGLVVLLAAVKRGLDLTDESDYIQSEMHGGAYLRASTEFQMLLGPALSLVAHVWWLRVVKLVGLVGAHMFFAWCFLSTAPSLIGARFKRSERIAVGAAITAGAFGVSRVLPQTPGYNDLTVFIVVMVSGVLLLLADRRLHGRAEPLAWFAVGLLIWLQLLARWPSAMAIVPLAAIAFFWTGLAARPLLTRSVAVVAGVGVGIVVTQLFLAPIPDIVRGIHQGNLDASAGLGYSRGHLLHQYVTNLSDLARVTSRSFWFLLAAAVAAGVLLTTRRFARPVAIAAAVGLVALTPAFVLSGRARGGVEPFGGPGLPLLLARSVVVPLYVILALLAGAAAFLFRKDVRPTLRAMAVVLALLGAPFLGGLGSNNPLWYSAALNPAFWIAAALALCAWTNREYGRLLVHGLAFAFATVLAFTAFDGTWHHPYRQVPLAADTVAVGVPGPLAGLHTDGPTAAFLAQVRATADAVAGSAPTDMVVWAGLQPYTAYGLPGASVASGLVQPLFAWLSAPYYADLSLAAGCRDHRRALLLVEYPSQQADLATNPTLTAACSGRQWTQRASIDGLDVLFAGPPNPS